MSREVKRSGKMLTRNAVASIFPLIFARRTHADVLRKARQISWEVKGSGKMLTRNAVASKLPLFFARRTHADVLRKARQISWEVRGLGIRTWNRGSKKFAFKGLREPTDGAKYVAIHCTVLAEVFLEPADIYRLFE